MPYCLYASSLVFTSRESALSSSTFSTNILSFADPTAIIPMAVGSGKEKQSASFDQLPLLTTPVVTPSDRMTCQQAVHFLILSLSCWLDQLEGIVGHAFASTDRIMASICAPVVEDSLVMFVEDCCKYDASIPFFLLADLDARLAEAADTRCTVLHARLSVVRQHLRRLADLFVNAQISAIRAERLSAKKRIGVLWLTETLVAFIHRCAGNEHTMRSCGVIAASVLKQLESMLAATDEKEQVNAAVTVITNCHHIAAHVADHEVADQARALMDRAVRLYAQLQLPKIYPVRLVTYLDGLQGQLLKTASKEEAAYHPDYTKTAARRHLAAIVPSTTTNLLMGHSTSLPQAIRSGVDYVRQRVEKHFGGALLHPVLQAVLQEAWVRWVEWDEAVRQVYNGDIELPLSADDLKSLLK